MPGPRAKQNAGKKTKHKVAPQDNAASSSAIPPDVLAALDGLPKGDWDKVAKVLCEHFQLPDLATRSGLKKVYHNFARVYKQMNDANEVIRGGVIAIYVKMCADSILRNMLFHQEGLLEKIVALADKPNTRHLALRALTTITQHGGSDIRKEISKHAPVMIKLLQDFPDDLYAAELVISTIAHAVTCAFDDPQKPATKHLKVLQLPKLIPLILSFVGKPGASLPLLHHALEFFGHITQHCSQDCLQFPDLIDFLIACLRSADMHSRFYTLGAVLRLHLPPPEKIVGDPRALVAAMQRGLPEHLSKLLVDYGPTRCDCTLTLRSFADYQNAMIRCVSDRDLYKLGLTLAELVPRNEFAIGEGGFQAVNERTGIAEFIDVGLPFKMWVDALPICAKAIRERGNAGEEDLADMLDMKFFVIRSQLHEAVALAKKSVERNPKFSYAYYIVTLGDDQELGLRCAKKGLKCKSATPFVSHVLRARAIEMAGNLAVCRMQESTVGDRKWEQGQAFMNSALDDAKIFLSEAPPDMRHRKSVLYWHIILSLVEKGPELATDLREFKKHADGLEIADEFFREFGVVAPKTQLRFVHQLVSSRYAAASKKWGSVVARLDSDGIEAYVLSRDRAEDRLAVWLDDVQDEGGEDDAAPAPAPADGRPEGSSHAKPSESRWQGLHRCSWCGNPSAVLRKCGGCETARYCDTSCQKLAWSEHKSECKSRKTAGSSA